ncbi:cytosine-specific methyltransferase [Terasakiella brassicae]|uniref:Cytosine-specific methyltransferase n=1 Tax=Terasakiella brassicae TaxID=1634917 RepID=A0A917BTZ6_9PROT|nr:DNA cytosine methyltransferase [Terasakiella brassicae]GGF56645.1 cytosine-specific methyltransferase [Terasakiella brassicae]
MDKPIIVDLFSGCGGFGLGAKLAGFDCRVAVDIDETLQSAYRLNFPQTQAIQADIGKLENSAWRFLLRDRKPDGVIGGPPCQGFSRIGKRDAEDPRNSLIGHFFRQVALLDPKFFIMENVEGLLDEGTVDVLMSAIQQITPRFRVLDPMIIKASDYGAPTTRTRVIVVGYNPNKMDALSLADFLPTSDIKPITVKDAIADLPMPVLSSRKKGDYSWAKYPSIELKSLSEYARAARKLPPKNMGWDVSVDRLMDRYSSGHETTIHTEKVAARYAALIPGKVDPVSKSTKLKWDGLCPTLRAGTGAEKGSHQAVRPIHPDEGRVITVREAARLQGFPDWFAFHHTKWTSFRMIGNSVSPKVSEFLLKQILSKIDSLKLQCAA